jgi:hypothetical protein
VLCDGVEMGANATAGFPSILSRKISHDVRDARVNVFGRPSTRESVVLCLQVEKSTGSNGGGVDGSDVPVASRADDIQHIVGKRFFVDWPYLRECMVKAVSDRTCRIVQREGQVKKQPHTPEQADKWTRDARLGRETLMSKRAVDVGDTNVVVEVVFLSGISRSARGDLTKCFEGETLPFPLQLAAERPTQIDKRFDERCAQDASVEFPLGTEVLLMQKPLTGTLARVVAHVNERIVEVEMELTPKVRPEQEFFGQRLVISKDDAWISPQQAAMLLKVPPFILSKMTSSVRVRGGMDIGLNIKFDKKGFCMVGYARKDVETNQWEYSGDALHLLIDYKKQFPEIFANIGKCSDSREGVDPKELLPAVEDREKYLQNVKDFLKRHPYARLPLMAINGKVCMYVCMHVCMCVRECVCSCKQHQVSPWE